jgi:hypothetical protein
MPWCVRAVCAAAACAVFGCLGAMRSEAAAPLPPRVVAVVPSGGGATLRQLDARTLKPVRGGWSRAVPNGVKAAVSPSGTRVAVNAKPGVVVLDAGTGRVVRRYSETGVGFERLYWLGGDGTHGGKDEILVGLIGFYCSSGGCGNELVGITPRGMTPDEVFAADPVTASREGLVMGGEKWLIVFGRDDPNDPFAHYFEIGLPRMSQTTPFRVVSDVAHNRLFAISNEGLVAEIDRLGDLRRGPRVRYRPVALNGRSFAASWAGGGRIALWGEDGLGTIDTRTWTTHAIARNIKDALATRHGIAAWTTDPADGLTIYLPDGRQRLRLLVGTQVKAARAVGDYLYAGTADAARYSVNLRTGKVVGPLATDATILVPDLVAIP